MSNLIINKLNNTLNEFLNNKLYQAYLTIDNLKIKMNNIISKIPQNEDNPNINALIINYQIILLNKKNQFTFKVSNIPFDYLYSFIKDVLEPPLLEIKKQYNLIEEGILGQILVITDNFPDVRQTIKEKLAIEDILEYIKLMSVEIKDLFLKYHNDLNDDFDSYINKLIHYTYINGLNYYDKPCNYSFCSINISEVKNKQRRNLKSYSKNKGDRKIKNRNFTYINFTKKNFGKEKKKVLKRRLTEYDETMGSLSKEEIIPYLNEIKNTIYELNETYMQYFNKNAKTKTNYYINKINVTYLIKLERTISIAISKFSPILTKESIEKLLNSIFNQFYKLENYIHNITNYLQDDINELIIKLKNTSNYIDLIYKLSFDQIIGYHAILNELIESKIEMNVNNNKKMSRNLNKKKDEDDDDLPDGPNEVDKETMNQFKDQFNDAKNNGRNIFFEFIKKKDDKFFQFNGILVKIWNKLIKDENINKDDIYEEIDLNVELTLVLEDFKKISMLGSVALTINLFEIAMPPFFFLFPPFPYLQIRIVPGFGLNLNLKLGFMLNFNKKEYNFYLDVSVDAEVSVSLEVGCYIPPIPSFPLGLEVSLSVGIKGILGSGTIGLKLSIFINKPIYEIELYYKFKACIFSFYILFKIKINYGILNFSFKFYIWNKILNSKEDLKYLTEEKKKKIFKQHKL